MLSDAACYRAFKSRDPRFDGRVFVGVTSTGIYCRPICPARSAKFENCRYFASAAAAQDAGFRPCLRCRPESAPQSGAWCGTSNTVTRALALIAEGALDDDDGSIDGLADRLGVGARELRRLFARHLGASPLAVAQTRRVLFAKQLLHETTLPMVEVAVAAGFGSVRRFNEVFRALFGRPPTTLRHARRGAVAKEGGVTVRLRYRPPYDWDAMHAFFTARAIDGLERVEDNRYARTFLHEGQPGAVEVVHLPAFDAFAVTVRVAEVRALPAIVARVRAVFDLDADVAAIGEELGRDPVLAPLVAAHPGLRVPGGWDGFELATRAILAQQVTLEAGRRLVAKLVAQCGAHVPASVSGDERLTRAFPSAAAIEAADLSSLGMPAARRAALTSLARAVREDPRLFEPRGTIDDMVARLCAVPGIGEWTAHYVALRAMREPDAFPATDVALLRASSTGGERPKHGALLARAERWRPWRGYAAQHLWTADANARAVREELEEVAS